MFNMNPHDKPTAILEIVILLLVAFLLGMLFTWLYWRKKYREQEQEWRAKTSRLSADLKGAKAAPSSAEKETEQAHQATADALELTGNADEDEAIQRVAARRSQVDFKRIGHALAEEKDNLQMIKGVGPFLEKKMNALGIISFRQVANFNEADEDTINEIIEFFPGRIKRDKWVAQARALVKNPPSEKEIEKAAKKAKKDEAKQKKDKAAKKAEKKAEEKASKGKK